MKKFFCVILALLTCLLLATVVAAAEGEAVNPDQGDIDIPMGWKCAHCHKTVSWDALPASIPTIGGKYHYYLTGPASPGQLLVKNGVTVCLDLKGYGLETNGRAMIAYTGSTVNIMDSSTKGTGYIQGSRGNNNNVGGSITVQENATLNLYSGTLQFQMDDVGSQKLIQAGVVKVKSGGAMHMFGGTVKGGELMLDETKPNYGGAISVGQNGQLTVSGGTITSGILPEGGIGPCVYLEDTTAKLTLSGSANVEDIYCQGINQLTISGAYTGTSNITFPGTVALADKAVVGVSDDADLTGGKVTCGDQWKLRVSGGDLVLTPGATVLICNGEGTEKFETLQEAVNNANTGYIKLMAPVAEDVTVSSDVYLDLNGQTVNGTVTVEAGATLYGMDSQTDDYTIEDETGYGKLKIAGEGQVLGLPEESALAEHGYMKITEADGVSFHAVNLKLTAMTLRADCAGVLYKSVFGGDELVADRVTGYGVALSVKAVPTADNLDTECKYTQIKKDFTAGGMDADATSSLLKNVLKPTNSILANNRNSNIPVYGRAYILTEDGYMFGASAQRTFKEQVEGVDAKWGKLDAGQKKSVVNMYKLYRTVMSSWTLPSLRAHMDPSGDGVLKIFGIGNSFTIDSMHLLYEVYKAENPDKEIVLSLAYYSGCSLSRHVSYIENNSAEYRCYRMDSSILESTGKWKITYDVTLKTMLEAENWDIVSLQQNSGNSATASTYNSDIGTIRDFVVETLGYEPEFAWNFTWGYPDDEELLNTSSTANNAQNFFKNHGTTEAMYNKISNAVQTKIVNGNYSFKYLMPVGTAVQNARSNYLTAKDLYKDYCHLNNLGRIIAAYTWFCELEGYDGETKALTDLKMTQIPSALAITSALSNGVTSLDDTLEAIVLESVNNAMHNKFTVTVVEK